MHILILAAGSAGDVYPFIEIGQELLRRGHAVELVAAEHYRNKVEAAGIGFISGVSRAQMDAIMADPLLWHPQRGFPTLWKHMGSKMLPLYRELESLLRPGDTLIVASTLALTARLAQELLHTRVATVHLAPSCLLSAYDASLPAGLRWLKAFPPWAVRTVLNLLERAILDPLICADLDPCRGALGLPPVRKVLSGWLHSPERVICAFPDWFAAPQPDWPQNTVCTAFPRLESRPGETLDPALQAFLDAGPAPIAFTPGSAMAHGRQFFERALAACAQLGQRAVLVTPFRDQLPAQLPPFAWHASYVPFDLLLPQVAAFVHHGGIGTSAKVLAAGKPQLVVPFAFDQPDNAARLIKLGVAASVAPTAPVRDWVAALAHLLHEPSIHEACRLRAAAIASERPAASQISDWIEAMETAHA